MKKKNVDTELTDWIFKRNLKIEFKLLYVRKFD